MRIAFLSPDLPYPVRHGGHVRTFGLIRCLSEFATVHVLAIGAPTPEQLAAARTGLAPLGASLDVFSATGPSRELGLIRRFPLALTHYASPQLAEAAQRLCRETPPDLLHVEEAVMAQYLDAFTCPAVLDRQKIEWAYHRSTARPQLAAGPRQWFQTLRSRLEARRFRRWDEALAPRIARVLVLGEGDRELLSPIYGHERAHVLPNGVDPRITLPPSRTNDVRYVLLYGTLDYPPNVEALQTYFRDVWPQLRSNWPELRTLVVGFGQPPDSLPADDPRVEVRGFVEEVQPILAGPGVLLVPLRVGGGIRNKILEALAAGMPVVSTAVGAENLGLQDGRHFLRAETAAEMVAAVGQVIRAPQLVSDLGHAGAAHVDSRYRWDRVARLVEPTYREAAVSGVPATRR
jgi:polysaccharide biosynthesis protein PslH